MLPEPRDKFDLEGANAIVQAGWPAAHAIAPQLLRWVQDANWPVARVLAPFLASAGAALSPYVREVLQGSSDAVWKHHLIATVVARSSTLTESLRPVLARVAFEPTPAEQAEEVDRVAREALEMRGIEAWKG